MSRCLYFLMIMASFVSCKKSETVIPPENHSLFLATQNTMFTGKLDNTSMDWRFGMAFQKSMSNENGTGICDPSDPIRLVSFSLIDNANPQDRFILYSPKYDASSNTAISSIFTPGKKKLGNKRTDFYFEWRLGSKTYSTTGSNTPGEIEILKAEEIINPIGMYIMRVWFKINGNMSTCACTNAKSVPVNGYLLAEFIEYRKP
ncbi:MAG: hypothetical protein JWP88_1915 [Flaviaesturariibacter sp.]|nr:hypothetical protein [Flaviaesturariibacter sp.]